MKNKRQNYVPPLTMVTQVELEAGFMSASITDDYGKGANVTATQQEYQEYDFEHLNETNWE